MNLTHTEINCSSKKGLVISNLRLTEPSSIHYSFSAVFNLSLVASENLQIAAGFAAGFSFADEVFVSANYLHLAFLKAVVASIESVIGHSYKTATRDHKSLAEQTILKSKG